MSKEAIAQETAEIVEETLDTLEHVRPGRLNLNGTTKGQQIAILTGVAVVGLAVGGFVGYKVAQKQLRLRYEEIAKKEIEEAKEYYGRLHKTDSETSDPEKLLEKLHGKEAVEAVRAHKSYLGEAESPASSEEDLNPAERALYEKHGVEVVEEKDGTLRATEVQETSVVRQNVFDNSSPVTDDGFDYEAELARRTSEKPYVITHDEYYECELDYEQTDLTYYEKDDTLVDSRDMPIPDEDNVVGSDNLTRFGHGSKDENIVYVRNDRMKVDFEISRSVGSYAQEVLGFDTERDLRHSDMRRGIRKFRHDE